MEAVPAPAHPALEIRINTHSLGQSHRLSPSTVQSPGHPWWQVRLEIAALSPQTSGSLRHHHSSKGRFRRRLTRRLSSDVSCPSWACRHVGLCFHVRRRASRQIKSFDPQTHDPETDGS